MIMPIALGAAFIIAEIVGLILWVMVLIKLFKNEGALKGILGFFCGIYVFIWGWMKHKQLAMTKTMTVWSLMIVIPMLIVPVMGVSSVLEMQKYVEAYTGEGELKISKPNSNGTLKKKLLSKRKARKKSLKTTARKTSKPAVSQDVDWSQKAMALWVKDRFRNPEKAVEYWSRAIGKKQNTVKAYNNRGIAYHELKQYDKAIDDYSQVIKLDPADVAAYNNRGNAYYELNKYQLALADFNQGLKRKPDYAKAHLNRGLVYYQMDETDKACRDFQNASEHGDDDGINWARKNAVCK
ncbi:MAG: tetratricopeptide repeat protein [Desulfobacterales bacterium]